MNALEISAASGHKNLKDKKSLSSKTSSKRSISVTNYQCLPNQVPTRASSKGQKRRSTA